MTRLITLLLFFITQPLVAKNIINERLTTAAVGDYSVYQIDNNCNLLYVHNICWPKITFEEITFPKGMKQPKSWQEWISLGAPGNTSWVRITLDIDNQNISNAFSFSRGAFFTIDEGDSMLAFLLGTPFSSVHKDEQKKIGPRPHGDEDDSRKVWVPPLIIDSKRIQRRSFSVFRGKTLSNTNSALGSKQIELYYTQGPILQPFPTWIEIKQNANLKLIIRAIDSGQNLTINKNNF